MDAANHAPMHVASWAEGEGPAPTLRDVVDGLLSKASSSESSPPNIAGTHVNVLQRAKLCEQSCESAALRYKVGLAYHGNAAETGEYLYDPSYADAGHRSDGQVVHTLNRMFIQSQCPTPLRAGLLGPRVVSPHPQGLQGSHLNLSQTSAQRHRRYFLVNNKAVIPVNDS